MITLLAFIIVLGVLIFFHELGHFIMAKASGVGVITFSLGFGPAIFKKRIGETEYQLAAVPLGGYVKMIGENPEEDADNPEIPYDPQRSFAEKKLGVKALIVAAGPIFNLVLAVLFYAILAWSGLQMLSPEPLVGEVKPDSPAYTAGILAGDRIVSIAGEPITQWEEISARLGQVEADQKIRIAVDRNGTIFDTVLVPQSVTEKNMFGEDVNRLIIGINHSGKTITRTYGPLEGLGYGFSQTWWVIEITGIAIKKMFDGSIELKDSLGGPIMIADVSGQTLKMGIKPFMALIAFISINLGLLNLLPIPILDGGHLLFFLIEAVIGRPVEGRPREIAQQVGLFLLMLLMILAFYNDITRLLTGK